MRLLRSLSLLSAFALAVGACSDSPTTTATRAATAPRADLTCTNQVSYVVVGGTTEVFTGNSGSLSATVYDTGNCVVSFSGHSFLWSSSNTAVASLSGSSFSGTGWTGNSPGTATISLNVDGHVGSAGVTVKAPPHLATLTLTPNPAQTAYGSQAYFQAAGKDQYGNAFNPGTLTWSSSNTAVATINSQGVATGTGRGVVTISASSGGVTGTAPLTIIPSVATNVPDELYDETYTVTATVQPAATYHYTWLERVCTNGGGCTNYTVISQGTNVTSVTRTMSPHDISRALRVDIRDYAGGPVVSTGGGSTLGAGEPDPNGSCYPRLIC